MGGKNKKKIKQPILPFVSICTPTFNRRPFIPFMIKCFENQTYPKDRIEWIIIDDGTDPIGDLVKDIPQVKYFFCEERMYLGKKRNYMHTKCSGDIIIYMDDDDYYPVDRISHAVEKLQQNPNYLIAGSSEMHIFFDSKNCIFQCGPYKENHATAATFAFKKELLNITRYEDEKTFAEENVFTKGYTIPLIQLDTVKTILVLSHKHNSLNKEKLLETPQECRITPSRFTIDDFIKDPLLKQFYTRDMNKALENYEPGRPENKPELMKQLKIREDEMNKRREEHYRQEQYRQEQYRQEQYNAMQKTNTQIETLCKEYEKKLADKNYIINELLKKVKTLTTEIADYKLEKNV
jgi:glycosyltransferase involved in cell wall biosynthesis